MNQTVKQTKMENSIKLGALNGITPVTPVKLQAVNKTPAQVQPITPTSAAVTSKTAEKPKNESTVGKLITENELKGMAVKASEKMQLISNEMKGLFLEREGVIESLFIALIAGHHVLLLGPPGTGKSAITKEFTSRIINGRMFEWLLNRTSDPSEILGPISIRNMERDKFIRILDGKIGDCEVAFIDEIFKSNEPTLNAMLPILNERVIYNDGQAVPIPLKMMVAASNETPEDGEGLEALYDRILFKHWVDYIKDPNNRIQMMVNYNAMKSPNTSNVIQRTRVTMDEIDALQQYKNYVEIPPSLIKDFNKLLIALAKQGIRFSDRKVNWCMDVIKASALFHGRTKATSSDIEPLINVLWERPEDVTEIEAQITKVIDPYSAKIKGWNNEAISRINDIMNLYDNEPRKAMEDTLEAKQGIEAIINKMEKTISDALREGKPVEEFTKIRNEVSKKLQELMCKTLGIQPSSFAESGHSTVNESVDVFTDGDSIW